MAYHTTTLPSNLRKVLIVFTLVSLAVLGWHAARQAHAPISAYHIKPDGSHLFSPWRGLPGCLTLAGGGAQAATYWPIFSGMALSCPPTMQPASDVPQNPGLRQALRLLAQPTASARDSTAPQVPVQGKTIKTIAKGTDVAITINPISQRIASKVAGCLTGGDCTGTGMDRPAIYPTLFENAPARTIALIDMRIDTGAIEATVSAESACFKRMSASGNPACPTMPPQYVKNNTSRIGSDHTLNNASMWGSLVKPSMVLAILRARGWAQSDAARKQLIEAIKTSNTPFLIDHLLCREAGFPADCAPLKHLPGAGRDLGYFDAAITASDLLGSVGAALGRTPAAPHWLEYRSPTSGAIQQWTENDMPMPADFDLLETCASNKWTKCRGPQVAELASNLWGQGSSLTTALTTAQAFARLGAAANGQRLAPAPTFLVPAQPGAATQSQRTAPLKVEPAWASLIVQGMSLTHTAGGTAHGACVAAFGNSKTCNALRTIAGKTGTPSFDDDTPYYVRLAQCSQVQARIAAVKQAREGGNLHATVSPSDRRKNGMCAMAPYKLYAMLRKDDDSPDAPYTHAVVVIAERGWNAKTGKVYDPGDHGPNTAAYTALQYTRLLQEAQTRQQPPGQLASAR